MNSNWSYSPETPDMGQNRRFFLAVWPCNLTYDLENNRAPLLCYLKLCASFRNHWWFKTGVKVRKRPMCVKFDEFFSRVTLKFDIWPWKTIGHLFYATSSCVHHFIIICEFKLELQSGNIKLGFGLCDIDLWPLNLHFCMDLTLVIGNNSWKRHDDTMMGT